MKAEKWILAGMMVVALSVWSQAAIVDVGGGSAFDYNWTLSADGSAPFVSDTFGSTRIDYHAENGGRKYLFLTTNTVGTVIWQFQADDGMVISDDVTVTGGCSNLNSGDGSYWEGLWSTDGETWTQFYYREGNWYNDELMTFALSDYGYAGDSQNIYIKWEGLRTGSSAYASQLFRGGLFEVTGSLVPEPVSLVLLGLGGLVLIRKK